MGLVASYPSHPSCSPGVPSWQLMSPLLPSKSHGVGLFFFLSLFLSLSNLVCSVWILCPCVFICRRPQEYHHYSWRSHCRFGSQSPPLLPSLPLWPPCLIQNHLFQSGVKSSLASFNPVVVLGPRTLCVVPKTCFHMLCSFYQQLLEAIVKLKQFSFTQG